MKKLTFIVLLLTCFIGSTYAQHNEDKYTKEKLETARIAFITSRLDLTPDQAQKFWPVFNQFSEVRETKLKEISSLMRTNDESLSEVEAKSRVEKKFKLQRELITQEEKFVDHLTGIIDYNQILKLNGLNREFARHVYQRRKRSN